MICGVQTYLLSLALFSFTSSSTSSSNDFYWLSKMSAFEIRLHRCWWWILETKCVGDNNTMLVPVLTISVTNIHYLFTQASGTNISKMSPTSNFSHQCTQIRTNFESLTSRCHLYHFHPWIFENQTWRHSVTDWMLNRSS